jgi:hypothetical protein
MTFSPTSIGFDCRGTPARLPLGRGLARAGGTGRAASHRERAAHHAAGHPQNRSFNQAPRCVRGISPAVRCSNAFTPLGENHGR